MKKIKLNEIRLEQTCTACPEQYDVFYRGRQVGYIRLRWGYLSVRYPDHAGEEIYSYIFPDTWKGSFDSERERTFFLNKAKRAILQRLLKGEK